FHDLPLSPSARTALFESRDPFLMSLYLGISALALVAMAVAAGRPPSRALFLVALAAALLAMGRHTPFYAWVAAVVPPVRMFRYPVKAMLPVALCWALLAAFGLDAWRGVEEMPRGRRAAVLAIAVGAVAMSVAWVWLAMGHLPSWARPFLTTDPSAPPWTVLLAPALRQIAPAALLTLAVLAARVAVRFRPSLGLRMMALAVVADFVLAAGVNRTCPPGLLDFRPPALAYVPRDRSRLYSYDEFLPSPL